jgi:tRNA threonylcarbamoyladenosine biosynthesis protein TsaB
VLLLALDTSTSFTAVALLSGARPLAERQLSSGGHSRSLLLLVDELLAEAGRTRGELEGVAVGMGPGSFTGVRIGLSVAKTLAFARGLPLLGISSLRALAENGRELPADEVCPALDALKGEVFSARYRLPSLEPLEPEGARAPADWARALASTSARRAFLGSGAERFREVLTAALGERAVLPAEPGLHRVSAVALGRLALARWERGERDDPQTLEPLYCRLSEAELGHRASDKSD